MYVYIYIYSEPLVCLVIRNLRIRPCWENIYFSLRLVYIKNTQMRKSNADIKNIK